MQDRNQNETFTVVTINVILPTFLSTLNNPIEIIDSRKFVSASYFH